MARASSSSSSTACWSSSRRTWASRSSRSKRTCRRRTGSTTTCSTARAILPQLLRGMYFWTWDTEEVLDMIRWMRAFNQSGKGRVEFTGFDMQTPVVAQDIVRAFIAKYDAPYLTTFDPASDAGAHGLRAGVDDGLRRGHRHVSEGRRGWQDDSLQRLHQDRGRDGVRGAVVARRWPVRHAGVRQHADARAQRHDRLAAVRDRAAGRRERPQHQLRHADAGPGHGVVRRPHDRDRRPAVRGSEPVCARFRAAGAAGFSPGNGLYRVALDSQVAHGGKQSLRISSIDSATTATAGTSSPDARTVAAQWKAIVAHLDAGRSSYRDGRGAGEGRRLGDPERARRRAVPADAQRRGEPRPEHGRQHQVDRSIRIRRRRSSSGRTTVTSPPAASAIRRWARRCGRSSAGRWSSSALRSIRDRSRRCRRREAG